MTETKSADENDKKKTTTVITPTVGRIVWYKADPDDHRQPLDDEQPCAAQIAYVHSDTSVNLMVVGHDGVPFSKLEVTLVQDGDDCPPGACQWMPYQKGQAAKTEALEKAQAEAKTG